MVAHLHATPENQECWNLATEDNHAVNIAAAGATAASVVTDNTAPEGENIRGLDVEMSNDSVPPISSVLQPATYEFRTTIRPLI